MNVTASDIDRFRVLVEDQLGLVFDDSKLEMLKDVLRRRCQARDLEPEAFLSRLAGTPRAELGPIASELTVGETYFFRNREQFRAFADVALSGRSHARPLRVLSAGCASGEEAFTIAIVVRESGVDPTAVSIRAVDVNPDALQRARRGRFSAWALRETPAHVQQTWFRPDGRDFVLDASIRSAVQFEQRNLVADDADLWAPAAYDVVFCRNVIMYFSPDTMRQVIARMARALRPGGYLFLGHAETLRGLSNEFHLCHTHGTFYYQRRDEHEAAHPAMITPVPEASVPSLVAVSEDADSWVGAIRRASERIQALAAEARVPAASPTTRWDLCAALELLREERFSDALTVLQQLPAEAARDPDVLLLRAVLLAHDGQVAAADAACRRLLEVDELSAGAHYVLALCHENAGDRQRAIEHNRIAVYLDPTFAMARLHLGLLAKRAGDRDLAQRELTQAMVLLEREDSSRLLLFGGGFQRGALVALCRGELATVEARS